MSSKHLQNRLNHKIKSTIAFLEFQSCSIFGSISRFIMVQIYNILWFQSKNIIVFNDLNRKKLLNKIEKYPIQGI